MPHGVTAAPPTPMQCVDTDYMARHVPTDLSRVNVRHSLLALLDLFAASVLYLRARAIMPDRRYAPARAAPPSIDGCT
jgi:hypothetical protein